VKTCIARLLSVVFLLVAATSAQSDHTSYTQPFNGSDLGIFTACDGSLFTIGGTFTMTTDRWTDGAGDLHTKSQVLDSNLSYVAGGITYQIVFAQKIMEVTSSDGPVRERITLRLKLLGPGSLNNMQFVVEADFTATEGLGAPPEGFRMVAKCTG
jgi:hypothetical protein